MWDPHQQCDVYNLEQVQRRGARFVTGRYQRHESVTEMITELKWNTLQQRRFTARQTMMWKAVNNQLAVHIPDHIHRPTKQSRGHHPHTYINVSSKTDGYKFSFYPRTICCWNLLPESIFMAESADNFKSAIWKSIDTQRIKP